MLARIHALESRGEAKLLAITIAKDHINAARYIELVNRFSIKVNMPQKYCTRKVSYQRPRGPTSTTSNTPRSLRRPPA